MDDLDILFSRIEQLELPTATREVQLARIAQATGRKTGDTAVHDHVVNAPVRRRHTAAALLTGAAVVAIVTAVWIVFAPSQAPVTSTTQPASAPITSSAPATAVGKTAMPTAHGPDLLTSAASAGELAKILHISTAAAQAGLLRLTALVDHNGSLDPTSAAFRAVATDLGTTPAALQQALIKIKMDASPVDSGPVTKQAGGVTGTASPGGGSLFTAPNAAARLADILHISQSAAQTTLTRLATLAGQAGPLDPTNPQFGAIAADIGITPAALNSALGSLKASYAPTGAQASGSAAASKAAGHLGQSDLLTAPGAAIKLATLLHISPATAKSGLSQLAVLAAKDHALIPTSQAFKKIAADMGTTPAALMQALGHIKAGK
jgi:hypothetical protein